MNRAIDLIGGVLLVAGTTIGGGMLALPVLTSLAGFVPSICIFFLCWLFMASTGLLILETIRWMPQKDANLISMANFTLGKGGRYFAWALYIFLFYCLTIAYIVGCGNILSEITNFWIPDWLGPLLFVIIFAPLILISTSLAGRLNLVLIAGLAVSFFAFVYLGYRFVKPELLAHQNWTQWAAVLPIAFTAFAYQGIVPTLLMYMRGDIRQTRNAILIGSFIPFLAYVVWQWLILGIIPVNGAGGLAEALQKGENAVYPLKSFINSPYIYYIGQAFAFFALITSFLGVALGLRDFLADGLHIQKNWQGKFKLSMMIFVVPTVIAILFPHIFLKALEFAGGFGCALLLGLLPILMVWRGRYQLHLGGHAILRGGRPVLIVLAVFVICEVLIEIARSV